MGRCETFIYPMVAYAIDYRGENDDEPHFVFKGLPDYYLEKIFDWIIKGGYIAQGFKLTHEHAPVKLRGACYWHTLVSLQPALNTSFISEKEFCLLIESRFEAEMQKMGRTKGIKAVGRYGIKKLSINKFLNV